MPTATNFLQALGRGLAPSGSKRKGPGASELPCDDLGAAPSSGTVIRSSESGSGRRGQKERASPRVSSHGLSLHNVPGLGLASEVARDGSALEVSG